LHNGGVVPNLLVVNKERLFMESVGAVRALADITDGLDTRLQEVAALQLQQQQQQRQQQDDKEPVRLPGWVSWHIIAAALLLVTVSAMAGCLLGLWLGGAMASTPASSSASPVESLCAELGQLVTTASSWSQPAALHPLTQLCAGRWHGALVNTGNAVVAASVAAATASSAEAMAATTMGTAAAAATTATTKTTATAAPTATTAAAAAAAAATLPNITTNNTISRDDVSTFPVMMRTNCSSGNGGERLVLCARTAAVATAGRWPSLKRGVQQ